MRHALTIFTVLLLAPFATAKEPVTVFLAGDSTMAPKQENKRPETGWGEQLQKHFDEKKVRVDNRALNGRSTKTFIAEGRWQALIENVKAGDYVLIGKYAGTEIKFEGQEYLILREEEVLGVAEGVTEHQLATV